MRAPTTGLLLALLLTLGAGGCATTSVSSEGRRSDVITRQEIVEVGANNLHDVVQRLRPRWLVVRSTRSLNMETAIVVFQNDMYLGPAATLREIAPELAWQIEYMDGARASASLPGITTGRHVEGAIIIRTEPVGER